MLHYSILNSYSFYLSIIYLLFVLILIAQVFSLCLSKSKTRKQSASYDGSSPSTKAGFCSKKRKDSKHSWRDSTESISTCELERVPECCSAEAGMEAKLRHRSLTWYPQCQIQKKSITRKNFALQAKIHGKHPDQRWYVPFKDADIVKRTEKYKNKHVTWDSICPVYIVYGFDECRGELEYDENTMDDTSEEEGRKLEQKIEALAKLQHKPPKKQKL